MVRQSKTKDLPSWCRADGSPRSHGERARRHALSSRSHGRRARRPVQCRRRAFRCSRRTDEHRDRARRRSAPKRYSLRNPVAFASSISLTGAARSRATGTFTPCPASATPAPTKSLVSCPSRSSSLMCAAFTSQLRCTRTNARPNDASTAASDRSMSNVPCIVCTNVSRSAASNAQISVRLEEHEAALAARDDPRRPLAHLCPRAPLLQPPQALRHALLVERLEQVVDDAELERLERVLLVRRRQHEHRRRRLRAPRPGRATARVSPRCPVELHVDERDVDAHPRAPRRSSACRASSSPPTAPTTSASPDASRARRGSFAPATRPRRRARGSEIRPPASAQASLGVGESRRSSAYPRARTRAGATRRAPRARAAAAPRAARTRPSRTSASGMPGPLSSTTHTSRHRRRAATRARPPRPSPSPRRSAPCFTAFSTSGWSRRRGSSACSAVGRHVPLGTAAPRGGAPRGSARTAAATRPACRATAARPSPAPRRAADRPGTTSRRRASRGSSVTSPAIALSVLSRKCGSRCARSRATSASLRSCCRLERARRARSRPRTGIDERERPEPEVHLRVQHAEERRAHQAHAVRESESKRRHVHRNDAVRQPEHARRTPVAMATPAPSPCAAVSRSRGATGERRGQREHEQRQLERHEDEAGENARACCPADDRVAGKLQQHDAEHHDHADGDRGRKEPRPRRRDGRHGWQARAGGEDRPGRSEHSGCGRGEHARSMQPWRVSAYNGAALYARLPVGSGARFVGGIGRLVTCSAARCNGDGILAERKRRCGDCAHSVPVSLAAAVPRTGRSVCPALRRPRHPHRALRPPSDPARSLDHGAGRRPGPASASLTLAQVERAALEQQPQMLVARAPPSVAEGQADQARAPLLPQVTGTAGVHAGDGQLRAAAPASTLQRPRQAPVGGSLFSQSYDLLELRPERRRSSSTTSGRRRRSTRRPKLTVDAQRYSEQARRASRSCSTCARAYFNARAMKELVDVAQETLDDQNKHLAQVQGMVTVGTQPPIALAQQKAACANARRAAHPGRRTTTRRRRRSSTRPRASSAAPTTTSATRRSGAVEDEDQPLETLAGKAIAARPEIAHAREAARGAGGHAELGQGRVRPDALGGGRGAPTPA